MTLQRFVPFGLLLAACGGEAPTTAATPSLTEEAIAALPVLHTAPGALVCTSIGADGCPLRGAVANRVGEDRIAIWEPGFTVYLFGPGDTLGTPIGLAGPAGQYSYAVAVTRAGSDRYRLLIADGTWRAIEIDAEGTISRTDTLPDPGILTAIGYVGERLIRQRMTGWMGDSGGRFLVSELRRLEDTTGTLLLEAPLPWLRGGNENGPPVPPLIASTPSWALTSEGDLVWSPGDRLLVERRSPAGRVRWRVEGGPGPRATEADLAARDSAVRLGSAMLPFTEEHFAEMRAKSDSILPAVSGLTTTPTGEVIVARTVFPTRDSVEYLRLNAEGTPTGRFSLDRRIKVLLAEGDSLLVHTPTEGEPWEVRWMTLGGAH